jgi:hypothetical protein
MEVPLHGILEYLDRAAPSGAAFYRIALAGTGGGQAPATPDVKSAKQ